MQTEGGVEMFAGDKMHTWLSCACKLPRKSNGDIGELNCFGGIFPGHVTSPLLHVSLGKYGK